MRPRKMTAVESATMLVSLRGLAAQTFRAHLLWCEMMEDKASDALKGIRAHLGRCNPGEEIHCLLLMNESLAELDTELTTERRAREDAERDRGKLIGALQRQRSMLREGRSVDDILADLQAALQDVGNDDEAMLP
jgi:hypothetical protein